MRFLWLLLGCCCLSACGTMEIGEANFIRPDKAAPAVAASAGKGAPVPTPPPAPSPAQADTARPATLALAALLPEARVSDETLALDEGAVAGGLSVAPPGAATTILYFGGNMFHIDQHGAALLPTLAACGANVSVFDYRGYGRSSGVPTIANMLRDALRIYDHVNGQHPGRVVVHGQSLGSFIAAYVAQQRPVAGMVLESTATTALDWANAGMPWYAAPFITIRIEPSLAAIDNTAAVAHYRGPSLVMTGARDKTTPPALARRVFAAIPGDAKTMLIGAGAGHNDVLADTQTAAAYCRFIASLGQRDVAASAGH